MRENIKFCKSGRSQFSHGVVMMAASETNVQSSSSKQHISSQRNKSRSPENSPKTAHDWRNERTTKMQDAGISPVEVAFYDDGTITFFWFVKFEFVIQMHILI